MVLAPRAQKTQFFIEYFDIFESSFQKTQFFIEYFDIFDFQPNLRRLRALRASFRLQERQAWLDWLGLPGPGRVGLAEQLDKTISFNMFSFLKL